MKSRICSAHLLGIALLMSAASASAGSIKAAAPATAARGGSAEVVVAEVTAFGPIQTLKVVDRIHSANSLFNGPVSSLSTFMSEPVQDSNRLPHHPRGPDPVPEPLSALLFGAAMLIGGIILRRRQRRATVSGGESSRGEG